MVSKLRNLSSLLHYLKGMITRAEISGAELFLIELDIFRGRLTAEIKRLSEQTPT
jgi:hypothetical protein